MLPGCSLHTMYIHRCVLSTKEEGKIDNPLRRTGKELLGHHHIPTVYSDLTEAKYQISMDSSTCPAKPSSTGMKPLPLIRKTENAMLSGNYPSTLVVRTIGDDTA